MTHLYIRETHDDTWGDHAHDCIADDLAEARYTSSANAAGASRLSAPVSPIAKRNIRYAQLVFAGVSPEDATRIVDGE